MGYDFDTSSFATTEYDLSSYALSLEFVTMYSDGSISVFYSGFEVQSTQSNTFALHRRAFFTAVIDVNVPFFAAICRR